MRMLKMSSVVCSQIQINQSPVSQQQSTTMVATNDLNICRRGGAKALVAEQALVACFSLAR
jgi:hypothetical protein